MAFEISSLLSEDFLCPANEIIENGFIKKQTTGIKNPDFCANFTLRLSDIILNGNSLTITTINTAPKIKQSVGKNGAGEKSKKAVYSLIGFEAYFTNAIIDMAKISDANISAIANELRTLFLRASKRHTRRALRESLFLRLSVIFLLKPENAQRQVANHAMRASNSTITPARIIASRGIGLKITEFINKVSNFSSFKLKWQGVARRDILRKVFKI